MENCGGELIRRLVVLSWFLNVQQIHAVIFYKSTYLPQQKLRIFYVFLTVHHSINSF
jgi:hypothetical protein